MIVGQPIDRIDAPDKVTGRAHYAAEFYLPRLATAVVLTSTIASGRIAAMDTSVARRSPGVLAVYSHQSFPKLTPPPDDAGGKPGEKTLPLQDDKIAYHGQIVAMVVADTEEQARYATSLIKIRYEATAPTLGKLGPNRGHEVDESNGRKLSEDRGNLEPVLSDASLVHHRATYTTPIEHHNAMEPPASMAWWEGSKLTLYSATQGVVGSRDVIAAVLGLEKGQVRVLSPFLGGGFGSKGFVWAHPLLSATASRLLGRPVRLVQTRQQSFTLNGHRSHTLQELALSANRQGQLQGLRHVTTSHTSTVSEFVETAGLVSRMLYACPNLHVSHRVVPLNLATPTPMRAPGESPGSFALESAMDELAYALELDPLELRMRNYTEVDPESGLPFSSKKLQQCYQRGAEKFGWSKRPARPRSLRSGNLLIGYGMATASYPGNRSTASARARIFADGHAEVASASQDLGTGTYTVMTQVAADALGLPTSSVRFVLGDSSLPASPGSGGSQTAASVGPAVQAACHGLRCKFLELASALAGKSADQVEAADGRLFLRDQPSLSESYTDILQRHGLASLEAEASIATAADEAKGKHSSGGCPAFNDAQADQDKKKYSFHSFGATFCEVAVDADLGTVRVRRVVTALDVGRVLNHKTARSQAIGGVIYGIGMGLLEHTPVDAQGRFVAHNLADYLVPVNADVPDIDVILIDEPDPHMNALGSRGIGEIGITGVAGALANAVYHATGKRVRDLPITPDKLLHV